MLNRNSTKAGISNLLIDAAQVPRLMPGAQLGEHLLNEWANEWISGPSQAEVGIFKVMGCSRGHLYHFPGVRGGYLLKMHSDSAFMPATPSLVICVQAQIWEPQLEIKAAGLECQWIRIQWVLEHRVRTHHMLILFLLSFSWTPSVSTSASLRTLITYI